MKNRQLDEEYFCLYPKISISSKSIWIHLKSQIEFLNLKIQSKSGIFYPVWKSILNKDPAEQCNVCVFNLNMIPTQPNSDLHLIISGWSNAKILGKLFPNWHWWFNSTSGPSTIYYPVIKDIPCYFEWTERSLLVCR